MTKEIENMQVKQSPYLEEPDTLDPTEHNKDDLKKGGGGQ